MITLCMDTAHKNLGIAILKGDKIIAQKMTPCRKLQSELLLPTVESLLKENFLFPQDIGEIVISRGPGSYTGVRIAMTVAKVLGAIAKLDVYTVSTLRLYAHGQCGISLIDARSARAYYGQYDGHNDYEGILTLTEVQERLESLQCAVYGDGSLIGLTDTYAPIGECFLAVKEHWEKVENIHALVPDYLKGQEAYRTLL